jgi:DNA oxidative demethylase
MMNDLFTEHDAGLRSYEELADGAVLLRGFARDQATTLLTAVQGIALAAPLRHMETPGGYRMSVAMTSCGAFGWLTDSRGYRYAKLDPLNGHPWPVMHDDFFSLANRAAEDAGFLNFSPDVCLVNHYIPGAKLSLHQDKDEADLTAPIVSVSFGLAVTFLLGGLKRNDPTVRLSLPHGDVLVWGGPSRLRYHAVLPIKEGRHFATGACRINLTFRKAMSGVQGR